MKKVFLPLICYPLLAMAGSNESNSELQTSSASTKISLYIPGFLMKVGSWFVNGEKSPEVKEALNKMRSVSICIREGSAYCDFNASGKYEKKLQKMRRQGFEEMISVNSENEKVSIALRQNNKGSIRQVVIIADDGEEEFVFLRLRCDFEADDIEKWVNNESLKSGDLAKLIKLDSY